MNVEQSNDSNLIRGYQLDHYALLERIGVGGEGAVWSAWDSRHHRVVALKLMQVPHGDLALASYLSNEFERQVHLIASLEHPYVLPLYEFGATDHYFYFVMRYNAFGSIFQSLLRGPLPVPDVMRLTAQIVSALDYLHTHGIIFRDLKPSNILLDGRGRPYLTDFGLAKRLGQETQSFHTGRGTGPYAPYEQHSQFGMSIQSDIFSLGVMLFEMFTGQLPWRGTIYLANQQKQDLGQLPDVRELNPRLPNTLNNALRELTAFRWQDRPDTASEAFFVLLDSLPDFDNVAMRKLARTMGAPDEGALLVEDAGGLLTWQVPEWQPRQAEFPMRLSHLALIDAATTQPHRTRLVLGPEERRFMLHGALVHDWRLDYWWQLLPQAEDRLTVAAQVLANEQEGAITRVLGKLRDSESLFTDHQLPRETLARLTNIATKARQWRMRHDALAIVDLAAPQPAKWQEETITAQSDGQLGVLALQRNKQGRQAARLVGRLRSDTAVKAMLQMQPKIGESRLTDALALVRSSAGSLPPVVPYPLRARLTVRQLAERFLEDQRGLSWSRVLLGGAAGLFAVLLMVLGFFAQQNAQMRDSLLVPFPVSDVVTIVAINDDTLAEYGRWDAWPRTLHADLIARLQAAGARAIVFDVLFAGETERDAVLADAMRQAGNVVQPVLGQGDGIQDTQHVVRFSERVLPNEDILTAVAGVGHTNILHDPDGLVRRLPTIVEVGDERYPSIAMAAIQVYLTGQAAQTGQLTPEDGLLAFAGRQIPVSDTGEMEIFFAGPPAQNGANTFTTVTYQDVLDGLVDAEVLADKIVLIGITATAEPDRYLTPVSGGRPMYGVEIMANVIESIWSGQFIRHPSPFLASLLLVFLGGLVGLVSFRPWSGLLFTLLIAAVYFLITNLLFDLQAVMLDLFYPFLAIALSYVAVTAYRFSLETRRRRQIMQIVAASVTPRVARATVAAVGRGEINLSGQAQEVTVLSVDMRGYHSLTRYDEPEAVMTMLESFREMVITAARNHEGTIAESQGGQIMVLFNAPLAQSDHVWRGVSTALAARSAVARYHTSLSEDHPERAVNLGYGIYSGRAIVGGAGKDKRQGYTAVGETVTVATELALQAAPGQILIGDRVQEAIAHLIEADSLPALLLRERSLPLPIHAVRRERVDLRTGVIEP